MALVLLLVAARMLLWSKAVAKPGVIGNGQQQCCGWVADQQRIDHFVTDGHLSRIACHLQRRLLPGTGLSPRHRQVEKLDQPPQQPFQRHIFTKGYQVSFHVPTLGVTNPNGRVAKDHPIARNNVYRRNAQNQARTGFPTTAIQVFQQPLRFMLKQGDCRLGPQQQIDAPVRF